MSLGRYLKGWVSIGALSLGLPALAQQPSTPSMQAGPAEDRVIVTARKREEDVQDVPAVVTALANETMEELGGVNNTRDLVQLLPGVTFIEAASSTVAEPNIRGAGQARLPNSDSAIGLYRDGAFIAGGNLGGRAFQRFDMFDTERVEVLRGPQGALYGRNAVGGAINAISQKPLFENTGSISLSYGDHETIGARGIYNQKLTDTLAFRAGIDYSNQDGCIYTRSDTGACYDFLTYTGVRGGLTWAPSDVFDVTFIADYSDAVNDSGGATLQRTGNPPIDVIQINGVNEVTVDQASFSLLASYDLGWAELVSTSNYRRRSSSSYTDPDGSLSNTQQDRRIDETETAFQEVRLQGEVNSLNWLVGADLFYLKNDWIIQERGRPNITNAMTMVTINPNSDLRTQQDVNSFGVYGSLEYTIDRLRLQGEARYSVDDKSAVIDAILTTGGPRYVDFPPGSPQTRPSRTFDNTSWGATASYRFTDEVMGFARAATAYRSGGFNSELGNPCNLPGEVPGQTCNVIDVPFNYDPETSVTYEAGVKTTFFNGRVNVNANVYRIEYTDMLANLNNGIMPMVDPLNGAMFLANAGDATANGVEIEMLARTRLPQQLGNLDIRATYGSQDGEFNAPPAWLTTVTEGYSLARLRPNSSTASLIYRKNLFGDWGLNASLTYRHESGGYQGAENDTNLDSYDVFGARVAVRNDNLTFALRVANLTNERYYTNQSGATLYRGISENYRLNDPRYVEASITYDW